MIKTAVVILNFNGKKYLQQFLPEVIALSTNACIVVADNHSTDGSVEFLKSEFSKIQLIEFDKNYGFAQGYNLALSQLKEYEYFVLLNSDIQVSPNWLDCMEEYLNRNLNITAIQPKILNYYTPEYFEYAGACGGFIDKYGYPFCRGRIFNSIEKDTGQYDIPVDIMWASGACLMIRANDFFEAGGLDSDFFAYQEEIDLCWRLKARGKRIICLPQSKVYHVGSGVLGADSPFKTYLNFRNNLLLLYKNLSDRKLKKVLFIRRWLDCLAAFQMIMVGKKENAKSVFKARKDFACLKKQFSDKRKENINKTVNHNIKELCEYSILLQYYVRNRKKFRLLY